MCVMYVRTRVCTCMYAYNSSGTLYPSLLFRSTLVACFVNSRKVLRSYVSGRRNERVRTRVVVRVRCSSLRGERGERGKEAEEEYEEGRCS